MDQDRTTGFTLPKPPQDPDFSVSQELAAAARPTRRAAARAPARGRERADPPPSTALPPSPKAKRGPKPADARRGSRDAMPPPLPKTRRGAAAAAAATTGPSHAPRVLTVKRSPPKDAKEEMERERTARATPAQRTATGGASVVPRTLPSPQDPPAPITTALPLPINAAAAGALMLQVPGTTADYNAVAIAELRAQVAALTTHATSLESRLNEKDAQITALSATLTAVQQGGVTPRGGRPPSAAATTQALLTLESQLRTIITSHNKHAASLETHANEITLLQGTVRRLAGDVAAALEAQRQDAHGRMTVDAGLSSCWEGIKALESKLIEVKMEVMEEVKKVGEVAYTGARASWPWGGFHLPTPNEEEK